MSIHEIILYLMTVFLVLAAVDRIFGSRLGLGKEFEAGILSFGSLALSMLVSFLTEWGHPDPPGSP